jgi:hypothetical protein
MASNQRSVNAGTRRKLASGVDTIRAMTIASATGPSRVRRRPAARTMASETTAIHTPVKNVRNLKLMYGPGTNAADAATGTPKVTSTISAVRDGRARHTNTISSASTSARPSAASGSRWAMATR